MRDEDTIVWESHAILRYLAARHGAAKFWSDDPAVRARVDGWMDWSQTSLQPDFLIGVFWGFFRTPESDRNWPAINASLARCAIHFGKLDRLLEGREFLLGDTLTLADITAGTSLYRYYELEIERPQFALLERWYRTLRERPAFCEHVMTPFEELRGRLDY
jgi:glutathione S-transferase